MALARLPWPLDPARIETRDDQAVARALLATPLRVEGGRLAPGLCSSWSGSGATWRLRCAHAAAIAAELRRAPLFAGTRVAVRGSELMVRGSSLWELTSVQAAPRGVPGPFRLVSGSRDEIVAERPGLRLVFRRLDPRVAVAAFRAGRVEEAPVPLGDIRAAEADPALRGEVQARQILAVDAVELDRSLPLRLRRVYWQTADRADYQALVPEYRADPALGLVSGARDDARSSPKLVRETRAQIPELPQIAVPIAVEAGLGYEAQLVTAQWRELGLGPYLARRSRVARFRRLEALYPRPDAIVAALGSSDEVLFRDATIVPLAWVADARLVSRRLRGWREDALGVPDYVRCRVSSRSR